MISFFDLWVNSNEQIIFHLLFHEIKQQIEHMTENTNNSFFTISTSMYFSSSSLPHR